MNDLKTENFSIDAYHHFTIVDEYGNRWTGECEPDFVFLYINSHGSELNIVRFDVAEIENLEKFDFDQIDDNTDESVLKEFIKDNHNYIKELLDYKLDNPDSNGEL